MAINDTVGDMLTRIRNGQQARKSVVSCLNSSQNRVIAQILEREGYIRGSAVSTIRDGITELKVELKYADNKPVIETISRVSKPGRRVYAKANEIGNVMSGLGIYILSTSQGMMTDVDAKEKGIGGEIICKVY